MKINQKIRNWILIIDILLLLTLYILIKFDVGRGQNFYALYVLVPVLSPIAWLAIISLVIFGLPILVKRTITAGKKIVGQNIPTNKKLSGAFEIILTWSLVLLAVLEFSKLFL